MVNGGPDSETAPPGEQEQGIAPTEYSVEDIQAFTSIEQKFQHFLSRTYGAGAVNGSCPSGQWSYDTEAHIWRLNGTPPVFGCVCLVATFITFWYNYNEDFQLSFALGSRPGIQWGFHESIIKHDVTIPQCAEDQASGTEPSGSAPPSRRFRPCRGRRIRDSPRQTWYGVHRDLRGYREFIEPEPGQSAVQELEFGGVWRFQGYVTKLATMNELVNEGYLLFDSEKSDRGRSYLAFTWNPEKLGNFNVFSKPGHVYLLVKRGAGSEREPPPAPTDQNTPHQVWKLEGQSAAGAAGDVINWKKDEIRLVGIRTPRGATPLDPSVRNQYPYLQEHDINFLSMRDISWNVRFPIWRLNDLRPNGQAPEISGYTADQFLNNPARYINSAPEGGASTPSPSGQPEAGSAPEDAGEPAESAPPVSPPAAQAEPEAAEAEPEGREMTES